MYTDFASVYDRLMADVDYEAWAAHYQRLMAQCGVPAKGKCVECACGTGSITLPLRRAGFQMTGVDLSGEMLACAMEKARKAGLQIPFVCQNMVELTVPRRVDCVLATCDGVNYLTTVDEVRNFFKAAYQALKPGGAFIFDVSTPEKLSKTLGNHTLFQDEEGFAYIWQNHYQESTAKVTLQLTIFVQRPDGAFDRFTEQQTQRAHSRTELRSWLKDAGFECISITGRMRLTQPHAGDDRWHICAKKPVEIE